MTGYRRTRLGIIDWSAERGRVEPILDSLAAEFSSTTMVRALSPANQTIVAIARALGQAVAGGALDLLVLDEATARLRGREADKVLATARLVARQGGGVLIITHHMQEVLKAADRATVLRNGEVAGVVKVAETTETELLELASGQRLATATTNPAAITAARSTSRDDKEVLNVSSMAGTRFFHEGEISIGAGEIVGLTGAPGAGHEEVPYLIAGAVRHGRATIFVAGQRVHNKGVHAARRDGVGLVPAERLEQGLLPRATVRENLSPLVRARHTRARLVVRRREFAWAQDILKRFQIVARHSDMAIATLSGGNQQKVLLARVLEDHPKVLLLHEPTEGVDEMTRRALAAKIHEVAQAEGMAVLYVSSDIKEVAEYSDRVLVVRDGRIVGEFHRGPDLAAKVYAACYLSDKGDRGDSSHEGRPDEN